MIKENYKKKNQMHVSFTWTCKTSHECAKWTKEITFAVTQKPTEISFTWRYKFSHDYAKCAPEWRYNVVNPFIICMTIRNGALSCKINIFSLKAPVTQIFSIFIESPWFEKNILHTPKDLTMCQLNF